MDKFTVALASLILFVLLLICAVTLVGQSPFYPPDGENGNVTATAIRIALADAGVAQATNNSYDKTCSVTNVSAYGDDGRSGLIGGREMLLKVSLMSSTVRRNLPVSALMTYFLAHGLTSGRVTTNRAPLV